MVELVSGRKACVYGVRSGVGLRYCRIEGGLTPSRSEARVAARAMKQARAARRSLGKARERATVAECGHFMSWANLWGSRIGGVMGSTARAVLYRQVKVKLERLC